MSAIQDSLNELRRAPGVKACILVTFDGLVVAESVGNKFRDDIIAGLASYLVMTTNKALGDGGLPAFDTFTVHAAHGKAVLIDVAGSILAVLLDQFADLEASRSEIQGTAQRLRRSAKLGS